MNARGMTPRRLGAIVLLVAALVAALGAYTHFLASPPKDCPICRRPVHAGMGLSARIGGKALRFCCPRCMVSYMRTEGGAVRQAMAADYATGKAVPAEECVYVEGSDLMPCCAPEVMVSGTERAVLTRCYDRCSPSAIAFAAAGEAAKFSQKHGGTVISYQALCDEAGRP